MSLSSFVAAPHFIRRAEIFLPDSSVMEEAVFCVMVSVDMMVLVSGFGIELISDTRFQKRPDRVSDLGVTRVCRVNSV